VVGLFTPTGTTLTGSITYDPLGKVLAASGVMGNLGYQSGWTESATGRVDMHHRWYNNDTGQFDTRDIASNTRHRHPGTRTGSPTSKPIR
jgi:large repetitive protein